MRVAAKGCTMQPATLCQLTASHSWQLRAKETKCGTKSKAGRDSVVYNLDANGLKICMAAPDSMAGLLSSAAGVNANCSSCGCDAAGAV
jgi:hypothetical protein